ncbi:MAG TPA: RNA polymerase sigma factor [Gemmatimonadaceae bacterium]|nr:RNA polymerase sigma factor [Gemmatimonadaceae bacterium]
MTLSDAAVVAQVLAGDTERFAVLVDRYYGRCLRLAIHIVGHREDAEDAVQETLLRAYRSLSRYQERDRFGSWLFRILVNRCRTALARRNRQRRDALSHADMRVEGATDADWLLREELSRALAQLSPHTREAIVLRFVEDLTYEEMAAITGKSISALKMRVHRGCVQLRALLPEEQGV